MHGPTRVPRSGEIPLNHRLAFSALFLLVLAAVCAPPRAGAHHPHDIVDGFAISPDFASDHTFLVGSAGTSNVFLRSENTGKIWTQSRCGAVSDGVDAMVAASDWGSSKVAWILTSSGRLQGSLNRGKSWRPPIGPEGLEHLTAPRFAGGDRNLFVASATTLYRSLDGGVTSFPVFETGDLADLEAPTIEVLTVSDRFDVDSTIALALGDTSLWMSDDGGASWELRSVQADISSIEIASDYASNQTLWLATKDQGVLESTDAGSTFAPINSGLGELYVTDVDAVPTYPFPPELFATTKEAGLYRSSDGGLSWEHTPLAVKLWDRVSVHYLDVETVRSYPNPPMVLCGTMEGLYGSFDGGDTWHQANINPTRFGHRIAISPSFASDGVITYAGYGMPFSVSEDGGESWSIRITDYAGMSSNSLAISPEFASDSLILSGTTGGIKRTVDRGLTWEEIPIPPPDSLIERNALRGITFSPTYGSDRTIFAISVHETTKIHRSSDGGATWPALPPPPAGRFWELALSPHYSTDSTLFIAGPDSTSRVHRSTDGGTTWTATASPLDAYQQLALAPDFVASGLAFAVTDTNGFIQSTDHCDTWSRRGMGLDPAMPTHFALSPQFESDRSIVLTTMSHGVHRSTDAGDTWQLVSSSCDKAASSSWVVLTPDYPTDPTIFIGTFEGVLRSTDGGASWSVVTTHEMYDDARDEPMVSFGTWSRAPYPGCIKRGFSYSDEPGARILFPFVGIGARVIGTRAPDQGMVDVYLDRGLFATVDTYAEGVELQQSLAEMVDLDDGFHQLEIRVRGEKNPSSAGETFRLDAIEVRYR